MTLILRESPPGTYVRALRERAGFSREELADLMHCTVQQLKSWELGRNEIPKHAWLLMRIICSTEARTEFVARLLAHARTRRIFKF
jgi:DNA-binding transcriptional regulator YiaG